MATIQASFLADHILFQQEDSQPILVVRGSGIEIRAPLTAESEARIQEWAAKDKHQALVEAAEARVRHAKLAHEDAYRRATYKGARMYRAFMKRLRYRKVTSLHYALARVLPGHNYSGCNKGDCAESWVGKRVSYDWKKIDADLDRIQEYIDYFEGQ